MLTQRELTGALLVVLLALFHSLSSLSLSLFTAPVRNAATFLSSCIERRDTLRWLNSAAGLPQHLGPTAYESEDGNRALGLGRPPWLANLTFATRATEMCFQNLAVTNGTPQAANKMADSSAAPQPPSTNDETTARPQAGPVKDLLIRWQREVQGTITCLPCRAASTRAVQNNGLYASDTRKKHSRLC